MRLENAVSKLYLVEPPKAQHSGVMQSTFQDSDEAIHKDSLETMMKIEDQLNKKTIIP
jgi:hypothetical protein